jgi:hypothetical protein
LQRDFLWDGFGEDLVSWIKVCTPISKGGLWVRNLLLFNRALLGKWPWCYAHEREALWRVVCVLMRSMSYGVGHWKNIRRGWREFSSHTRFDVGDNSKIRFWHDVWCGDQALKIGFLD